MDEKKVVASVERADKKAAAKIVKTAKKAAKTVKKATAKAAKKAAPKLSVKARLAKYLQAARVFRPLEIIYEKMGAKTPIAKAGVRGVLNRNFQDANSLFERNPANRGEYRLRGKSAVTTKAA